MEPTDGGLRDSGHTHQLIVVLDWLRRWHSRRRAPRYRPGGGGGERILLGHASSKQLKPKAAVGLKNSAAELGYALKLMRTKRGHFISRAVLARIILFPNPAATRSMQGQN